MEVNHQWEVLAVYTFITWLWDKIACMINLSSKVSKFKLFKNRDWAELKEVCKSVCFKSILHIYIYIFCDLADIFIKLLKTSGIISRRHLMILNWLDCSIIQHLRGFLFISRIKWSDRFLPAASKWGGKYSKYLITVVNNNINNKNNTNNKVSAAKSSLQNKYYEFLTVFKLIVFYRS